MIRSTFYRKRGVHGACGRHWRMLLMSVALLLQWLLVGTLRAQQSKLTPNVLTSTAIVNGGTPSFAVTQTSATTGLSSWAGCSFNGACPARVIDSDLGNYARANVVLGGSATIRVTDPVNDYQAGNFAGFVVNPGDLGVGAFSITVRTYLDGVERESKVLSSALSLVDLGGAYEAGFYTTLSYDAIAITYSYTGIGAANFDVYYAVMRAFAAGPALTCNANTALTAPAYPAVIATEHTGVSGLSLSVLANTGNVIDNDPATYASVTTTVGLVGNISLAVKDAVTDYPAGTFAGFDIQNTSLLDVSLLGGITITTYKDGISQESQSGAGLLLGAGFLTASGRQVVGFVATKAFDEIQFTINQGLISLDLGQTRIYGAVVKKFCEGPAMACNTSTYLNESTYPVLIDNQRTGISGGAALGSVTGLGNLLDGNTTNYASITIGAGALTSGSISVRKELTPWPAGTFAGFDINNPSLIGVNLLSGLTVSLYNSASATPNTPVQTVSGGSLVSLASSLASGTGRQLVGLNATVPFDEIRLTITQTASLSLGTTQVFGAVIRKFCAGPALACNTQTRLTNPAFPVYVDGANTGITSLGCAGCQINDSERVTDADTTNYATVVLVAGAASTAQFAVGNALDTYQAGSFAGFDVEAGTLLSGGILSSMTISLYNNGALVQSGTGNSLIVGATSSLLTGVSRQLVGIVATADFDEVKISFSQLVGGNLGNVKIYNLVVQKSCPGLLTCNNTFWLKAPKYPAVINSARSGITGAACGACTIQDIWNVATGDASKYARIQIAAGFLSQGAISVVDPSTTYPAGSYAGFAIRDVNNFLQASLFDAITIETYNNGVLMESKTGGNLINFAVIIPWLGPGAGVYNVGFKTTKDFDEIVIKVGSVGGALTITDVYSAYVDTREVPAGSVSCPYPDLTPSQFFTSLQLLPGQSVDYVVAVSNVGPMATSGTIEFFVTRFGTATGLTITPKSVSSVVIDGETFTLNNTEFDITQETTRFKIVSKSGIVIPSLGVKFIGFTITRAAGTPGSLNNTVMITNGTGGGETPTNNNAIANTVTKL